MILRLDDTDVERNTQASVDSTFEGLKWLNLPWDEEYKQSERSELHRKTAWAFSRRPAYRDFTPAHTGDAEKSGARGAWLFNPGVREVSRAESDRRAAAGERFALRFAFPQEPGIGEIYRCGLLASKSKPPLTLKTLRCSALTACPLTISPRAPTMPTCTLPRIRGQDHLSNTYKHVLIFEAAGYAPPQFAHLPLLVAPTERNFPATVMGRWLM